MAKNANQAEGTGTDTQGTDIQLENERLKKELEEAMSLLKTASKNGGNVAVPVPGFFSVVVETADGEKVETKYRFKPGRVRVPLAHGIPVSSASLIKMANGEKLTDTELAESPELNKITPEAALARLCKLAEIGASFLEEVK